MTAEDFSFEPESPKPNAQLVIKQRPIQADAPERQPPSSPESEEHVLACVLLDGGETLTKAIEHGIDATYFYYPANVAIFQAILAMHHAGKPIAVDVLAQELKTARKLEAVGGIQYLMQVTGKIPTTAHASYFIAKVVEHHHRREIIRTSNKAVEQAYAGIDVAQIVDDTGSTLAALKPGSNAKSILNETLYRPEKRVVKPEPIFSALGTTICTMGNLTTLYSQAKVGKTAVTAAMIAAKIIASTKPGAVNDCLGFAGSDPQGHAIIHFDTEQSPFDRQNMIDGILRRADEDALPSWFCSHLLTGHTSAECRAVLEESITRYRAKFGGIHAIFLDGVGDLVSDVNEGPECNALVAYLHKLAIDNNCSIINILHLNPTSETKGRGHLGSQLERKSESNLMMEKDEDGITRLWAEKQRGKMISKANALAFRWSDEDGMHMSTTVPGPKPKGGRVAQFQLSQFNAIIPRTADKAMTRQQLFRYAVDIAKISETVFRDMLIAATDAGELKRIPKGTGFVYYVPGDPSDKAPTS